MAERGHTYDAEFPAITEVVSEPHTLLGLVYGNSRKGTYNAMAFQVTRSIRRVERVTDSFTLNDNELQEFGYFGENGFSREVSNPGTEVWEIESERENTIAEFGFAVPQDGVWVGMQAGDGSNINGLREGSEQNRGWSASDLKDRGGVLSDMTYIDSPTVTNDYPMPTTALATRHHQGLVRIDSRENGPNRFRFAFDNESGGQVTVDMIGYGQAYDVRQIQDETVVRDIISGNGYNRRLLTYGGFENSKPNLPEGWYENRVELDPGELTPGVSG